MSGAYVYAISPLGSLPVYVGATSRIDVRTVAHKGKYGEAFCVTLLDRAFSAAELNAKERDWIARCRGLGYPLTNKRNGGGINGRSVDFAIESHQLAEDRRAISAVANFLSARIGNVVRWNERLEYPA